MAVTIEEARAFIADAAKYRDGWLSIANSSWSEIKKLQQDGNFYSVNPNAVRRRGRYPAWYSIFKIRGPLLLSRIGIPIGKDTTQDGSDNVGATAAMCLERLAKNLARNQEDFFDVMASARDDFLVTNFGFVRAFYERKEVKEKVKEYISPTKQISRLTGQEEVVFLGADGEVVTSDDILQDDEGYFVEHDETVDVEDESIYLEPVLYREVYVDPGIKRWARCKRLAFALWYSKEEFRRVFGNEALKFIATPNDGAASTSTDASGSYDGDQSKRKDQLIKVYEYWDEYDKDCYYFADNGEGFIKPKSDYMPEEYDEELGQLNGLYDLHSFFPCPKPLVMNQPTDGFWPVPEFYQVMEITQDIHTIFSRMMALTRAIRARLLFDNNVQGLEEAIAELKETDAIGVSNLTQALMASGGKLTNVVQYLPVAEMIEGLNQIYIALEQRLQSLFRLTGTSDLLQGLSQDQSGKTLGERQMEEKYAVNQLEEPQRKMAEFVRDSYQLICEMALKNFKDSSLDQYIIPATLPPEHRQRYHAAMGLLKDDTKRFRIELETDSTIALNENYDKAVRIEMVNALTTAVEKTSQTIQSAPALAKLELHAIKYLIQGFRGAYLFQGEVTEAIDNVIKGLENAPPAFNAEEAQAKINGGKLQLENNKVRAEMQFKFAQLQGDQRIEQIKVFTTQQVAAAKIRSDQQIAMLENQVKAFAAQVSAMKVSGEQQAVQAELQMQYAKLSADVGEAQARLALDRDALMVELRKIVTAEQAAQFEMMIDSQFEPARLQLEAQSHEIDQAEIQLRAQDQALKAQDQTFQAINAQIDNARQEARMQLDAAALSHEMAKPPEIPPITINVAEPTPASEQIEIERDKQGNLTKVKAKKKKG